MHQPASHETERSGEVLDTVTATSTGEHVTLPAQFAHTGKVMPSAELEVFELPETNNYLATNNPEGLAGILSEGLDTAPEGDVIFTSVSSLEASPSDPAHNAPEYIKVLSISRQGDHFSIHEMRGSIDGRATTKGDAGDVRSVEIPFDKEKSADRAALAFNSPFGVMPLSNGSDLGLGRRNDLLGNSARVMGFSEVAEGESPQLPLPQTIQKGVQQLQQQGIDVPHVRFFGAKGEIDAPDFVQAFADGVFPASAQPDYIVHDIGQEHFRPLIVFGSDAMRFAQLYAEAVRDADDIVTLQPIDPYQVNLEVPVLEERHYAGEQKLKVGALILDVFTSELDGLAECIDQPITDLADEVTTEQPSRYWRESKVMANTLMNSPYRARFVALMEELSPDIIDPQTGSFSFEAFAKTLLSRAQQRWHIEPQPVAVSESVISEIPPEERD